jgi:hypothetical protein
MKAISEQGWFMIREVMERMVAKTNNLSAAIKNSASHFQRFAFFC